MADHFPATPAPVRPHARLEALLDVGNCSRSVTYNQEALGRSVDRLADAARRAHGAGADVDEITVAAAAVDRELVVGWLGLTDAVAQPRTSGGAS